ncbi:hypothetical protein AV540_26210 [Brevibacillus parabrevis]|uniref:Kelch repeat-containing protein n=1 Tax=Brevibacillus parabrevis TaxID=54914 RepID=UPI0007AB67C4|nr:hypothetical protein [Brevibacillus parabrevis]KZE55705.1 hypothetical protein AV540_26210 [Brevibacillus parabrevis]
MDAVAYALASAIGIQGDEWTSKAIMPSVRSKCKAAGANGKLFVIGGYNGSTSVAINEEFNPVTNTWSTKAPMPKAKYQAAGVGTTDKIFIFHGESSLAIETLIFDIINNSWSYGPNAPLVLIGATAVYVNNEILIYGGRTDSSFADYQWCRVLQRYDPVKGTWSSGAYGITDRGDCAVAALDGKLYAAGGYLKSSPGTYSRALEEYTPQRINSASLLGWLAAN